MRTLNADQLKAVLSMESSLGHIHTLADVENTIDYLAKEEPEAVAGVEKFNIFDTMWSRKIQAAFPQSFVNMQNELVFSLRTDSGFSLKDVTNETQLKAKILEWLTRTAIKAVSPKERKLHFEGINKLLGTNFTLEEMTDIYTYLGNGINHDLCVKFVESGYDMTMIQKKGEQMDKQKIKSVPRLTTDNPVNNFQTALNFTDVSEDGWVWLRQPEMALTEYARQLVKGHGSSIDLGCNDMELSESLTDHLFDDPKQSIDGLIAEHYTILWAYATLREKLKWYEDAGIPVIPNYGLSTIRRAINRYGTAPQLQMAIKEMSELTKAICNLQRAVTFNYRNGAKIKVAHESVREEIADVYIMLAQLVEIVGKPEEVQQIVLEKLEQLKGCLDDGEVRSE